jgi:putative oxidoreductase
MNGPIPRRTLARREGFGLDIALWIVAGLLAVLFFTTGGAKFIGRMNDQFQAWGYTRDLAVMIGILELLGAVGLLVRRTAGWAAVGLMVIMLGAAWTHAAHQEYVALITPTVVFVALAFVAWGRGLNWQTRPLPGAELTQP